MNNLNWVMSWFNSYIHNSDWIVSWFTAYTQNILFITHCILFIILIFDTLSSFYNFFRKNRRIINSEPLMVDFFINKIDHRYHLYAELFLFTGLAGTALVIQHILVQGGLEKANILNLRTGIAFSAGGIIWTMFCYILKELILLCYRNGIEVSHRIKTKNDHVTEFHRLNENLKILIDSQLNPTAQIQDFLNQVKELKIIFDSNKIPQYFTAEMSKVISQWERHSDEQLKTLAISVTAATDMLSHIDELTNKQLSLSDKFLDRLQDIQLWFSKTQREIGEFKTDISNVRESFLVEVSKIPTILNEKSNIIINDLGKTQKEIMSEFHDNTKVFYTSHREYIEGNQKIIEESIRLSVKESYALLKKNMERITESLNSNIHNQHLESVQKLEKYHNIIQQTMEILRSNINTEHEGYSKKLEQYYNNIEQTMAILRSNIHTEHEEYTKKLEKYHNIIDISEHAVNKRVEETSLVFQKQMDDAVNYHKQLLNVHYQNDNRMVRALGNSIQKLEALISEQFVDNINQNTSGLISSMSGCNDTMLKFEGLFRTYYEDLEKLHSTLSQSNVLLNFLRLIGRKKQ